MAVSVYSAIYNRALQEQVFVEEEVCTKSLTQTSSPFHFLLPNTITDLCMGC